MNFGDEFYGFNMQQCADLCKRITDHQFPYVVTVDDEKYSTIFGDDELINKDEFEEYLNVPVMPLRCLCGCNNLFSICTQIHTYKNNNKFKLFYNSNHIQDFKRKTFYSFLRKN